MPQLLDVWADICDGDMGGFVIRVAVGPTGTPRENMTAEFYGPYQEQAHAQAALDGVVRKKIDAGLVTFAKAHNATVVAGLPVAES